MRCRKLFHIFSSLTPTTTWLILNMITVFHLIRK
uniref:Uncharacterized protein LOC105116869 n=1 Tax=Rhizophora mucronata TaxID=61149 RepID=A0A2P2JUG7_RHIMU